MPLILADLSRMLNVLVVPWFLPVVDTLRRGDERTVAMGAGKHPEKARRCSGCRAELLTKHPEGFQREAPASVRMERSIGQRIRQGIRAEGGLRDLFPTYKK
jgi:hypothetical protein